MGFRTNIGATLMSTLKHCCYFKFPLEIGVNLSDRMYQGEYNGSKKHEADLPDVLERAWNAGIDRMIITGGSLNDAKKAIEFSKMDGNCSNTC